MSEGGILVTRLNSNAPVTIGPFADQLEAETRGKALKAEYPSCDVVFSTITAHVVEVPERYTVETL